MQKQNCNWASMEQNESRAFSFYVHQGLIQDLNLGGARWWPGSEIQRLSELPSPWPHHGWWWREEFLDALKRFISQLILPEKTWKGIKTVFFKKSKLLNIFQNFWICARRSRRQIALCAMKICLNYPLKYQLDPRDRCRVKTWVMGG